jgi:uncharacterized membrane protein (DUF485 family)
MIFRGQGFRIRLSQPAIAVSHAAGIHPGVSRISKKWGQTMTGSSAPPKLNPALEKTFTVERWAEAFESDTFKSIVKKRFGFIVPALLLFSGVFFVLWVIQSSFPAVARYPVYGWVNINFVYTMAIFPFVWILGYVFVRYIRREVYPLEDELNRKFGKGPKHE